MAKEVSDKKKSKTKKSKKNISKKNSKTKKTKKIKKSEKVSKQKNVPSIMGHVSTTTSGHPNSHIPIAHNQTLMVERRDQNDAKALENIKEDINTGKKVVANLVNNNKKPEVVIVDKTTKKTKISPEERENAKRTNEKIAIKKKPKVKIEKEKEKEKPLTKTEELYKEWLGMGGEPISGKLNFNNIKSRIKKLKEAQNEEEEEDVQPKTFEQIMSGMKSKVNELSNSYGRTNYNAFVANPIPDPVDYGVNLTLNDLSDSSDPTTIVDNNLPQLQDNSQQSNFSGLNMGGDSNLFPSSQDDSLFSD